MPKDIIHSKLEKDNQSVDLAKKNDLVDRKFTAAVKAQFPGDTPEEKAILNCLAEKDNAQALLAIRKYIAKTEASTDLTAAGGVDGKLNTLSQKTKYIEKLVSLAAYLEEINGLESSKQVEINALLDDIQKDLKTEVQLDETQYTEAVKANYLTKSRTGNIVSPNVAEEQPKKLTLKERIRQGDYIGKKRNAVYGTAGNTSQPKSYAEISQENKNLQKNIVENKNLTEDMTTVKDRVFNTLEAGFAAGKSGRTVRIDKIYTTDGINIISKDGRLEALYRVVETNGVVGFKNPAGGGIYSEEALYKKYNIKNAPVTTSLVKNDNLNLGSLNLTSPSNSGETKESANGNDGYTTEEEMGNRATFYKGVNYERGILTIKANPDQKIKVKNKTGKLVEINSPYITDTVYTIDKTITSGPNLKREGDPYLPPRHYTLEQIKKIHGLKDQGLLDFELPSNQTLENKKDNAQEAAARKLAKAQGIPFKNEREAIADGDVIVYNNGNQSPKDGYEWIAIPTSNMLNFAVKAKKSTTAESPQNLLAGLTDATFDVGAPEKQIAGNTGSFDPTLFSDDAAALDLKYHEKASTMAEIKEEKVARSLFEKKTNLALEKVIYQEKMTLSTEVIPGYSFRDFAKTISNINVPSAYSTLQKSFPQKNAKGEFDDKTLNEYWEKNAAAAGGYTVDGDRLNHREKKFLREFTKFMDVVRDKNSKAELLDKETALAHDIVLSMKASSEQSKDRQLSDALVSYKIGASLREKDLSQEPNLTGVIAAILGDYNADGKAEVVDGKKNTMRDAGTVHGIQIATAYEDQKKILYTKIAGADYEAKANDMMAQGLLGIMIDYAVNTQYKGKLDLGIFVDKGLVVQKKIGNRMTYVVNEAKLVTLKEQDLAQMIKEYPQMVLVLRNLFQNNGEHFTTLLDQGRRYAEEIMERMKPSVDKAKKKTEVTPTIVDAGGIVLSKRAMAIDVSPENKKSLSDKFDAGLKSAEQQLNDLSLPADKLAEAKAGLAALEKNKEKNLKAITINLVGAGISTIEDAEGVGAGVNITSERINDWLSTQTANNSLNLTPGVGVTPDGNVSLGLALSFAGDKTFNQHNKSGKGGEHRIMYAAALGAGLYQGVLIAGPMVALGYEEQINGSAIKNSMELKSAKYIGAMAHATLLSWGVDGYYRRDLKEGILQGENAVKADVKALLDDIINTAITSKKPLNQDAILAILQGKRTIAMGKNNGDGKMSNTDNAILYKAAQNILLQIKPYEQYLLSTDKDTKNLVKDTKGAVASMIAENYALTRRNTQMTKLNGTVARTGIGGGIEFLAGVIPLPRVGVSFSKYKGLQYVENEASLTKVNDMIGRGAGVDEDNAMAVMPLADRVERLNKAYGEGLFVGSVENGKEYISISNALLKSVTLYVSPEQANFMRYENGGLKIPADMSVLLNTVYRDTHKEYVFLLGGKETKNMKKVPMDKVADIFANGAPENYDAKSFASYESGAAKEAFAKNPALQKYLSSPEIDNANRTMKFQLAKDMKFKIPGAFKDKIKFIAPSATDRNAYVVMPLDTETVMIAEPNKPITFTLNSEKKSFALTLIEKKEEIIKQTSSILDKARTLFAPSETTKKFVSQENEPENNNKEVMNMKYTKGPDGRYTQSHNANFVAFSRAMQAGSLESAKGFLAKMMGISKDKLTDNDARVMNVKFASSLSTRDKDINSIAGGEDKLVEYAQSLAQDINEKVPASLKISDKLLGKINAILRCLQCEQGDKDALQNTLGRIEKSASTKNVKEKAQRLRNMLMTLQDVVGNRTQYLRQHIIAEFSNKKEGSAIWKSVDSLRTSAVSQFEGSTIYAGETKKNAIGMVMGYSNDVGGGMQEKFVTEPKISTLQGQSKNFAVDMPEGSHTELKRYFLNSLFKKDPKLAESIREKVNTDKKYANDGEIINAIMDGTIKAKFEFAYYNECFNESVLITIDDKQNPSPDNTEDKKKTETQTTLTLPTVSGRYVNSYASTNQANLKTKNYIIGGTTGQKASKPGAQSSAGGSGGGDGGSGSGSGQGG